MIFFLMFILIVSSECAKLANLQNEEYLFHNEQQKNQLQQTAIHKEINSKIQELILSYLKNHSFNPDSLEEEKQENSVNKRELKRQGILERMKNKMDHDLNKFGWD